MMTTTAVASATATATATATNDSKTIMFRGTANSRHLGLVGEQKTPLNPDKDEAARPYDPHWKWTSEGNNDNDEGISNNNSNNNDQNLPSANNQNNNESAVDGPSNGESAPPPQQQESGPVESLLPNEVVQVSYSVGVMGEENDTLYLNDLKRALGILASQIAPQSFPNLLIDDVIVSMNGWFPISK
jgi:hypothetical protein